MSIAAAPSTAAPAHRPNQPKVTIIGAGAFGGWTAYSLLDRANVTLIDAWGPGNARASSGGETRMLRWVYTRPLFVDLALRSYELWEEAEQRWKIKLFQRTGCLWMGHDKTVAAYLEVARKIQKPIEEITAAAARKRYPQIHFGDEERVFYEPKVGFLRAREACRVVAEGIVAEGGAYQTLEARPGPIQGGRMEHLVLSDGSRLEADAYVFACGSWLARLFPGVLDQHISPTRQEVFYFGTPAGDTRFSETEMPCWSDRGSGGFYGIPGNRSRGFKIANHHRGQPFDPSNDDRVPAPEQIERARRCIERRFPDLAGAPLIESRVCHYSNSPDGSFIVDRHPEAENVWLIGGGSGHGFKHGPALGEKVANWVLEEAPPEEAFSLARFDRPSQARS